MIVLYSGTPGSGKSYHMAERVYTALKYNGKTVISNTAVDIDNLELTTCGFLLKSIYNKLQRLFNLKLPDSFARKKVKGTFIYLPNDELTPEYLMEYAMLNFKKGVEGQALLVIDEAAIMFNSRSWNMKSRQAWVKFFQTHRHYGYDVILVCQHDRMLDRQIRAFIEYEYIHRNAKFCGLNGWFLSLLFGGNLFVVVQKWVGCRERIGTSFCRFSRRIASLYDSYQIF